MIINPETIFFNFIKKAMFFVISFCLIQCNNNSASKKEILLKAGREAQLGWVYLTIYKDSTFQFAYTGLRGDYDIYNGKVSIKKDSMFFSYQDSIPRAGTKVIYNNKRIAYVDGEYPESLNISESKLNAENK